MGGYVTVPGGLSAALRRRPLLLVNSDAALLLSNKILWPFARRVLFGLPGYVDPQSRGSHRAPKAEWTGSPVRAEIAAIAEPAVRFAGRSGPLKVFAVGGSLGAAVLNRVVPLAIATLAPEERPIVTHQSGLQHINALRAAYAEAGVIAETLPFIEDMAERYAEADVVICRAGALTINELMVAGVASVLVPLTVSTTSHQRDNAETMQRVGAAIHLPQPQLTPEKLAGLLRSLTREQLLEMAQTARKLARPDASERVADIIEAEATAE
jgi:UDP-N-acetylglucosamine--N-acetylmuramyl-(pentapeptide) pyrophosphoryl-undecaprenol N-acetylglucosamine transferase